MNRETPFGASISWERHTMKSVILAVIAGTLLAGCSVRSETVVERPVATPASTVVATPLAGTVYVTR